MIKVVMAFHVHRPIRSPNNGPSTMDNNYSTRNNYYPTEHVNMVQVQGGSAHACAYTLT